MARIGGSGGKGGDGRDAGIMFARRGDGLFTDLDDLRECNIREVFHRALMGY